MVTWSELLRRSAYGYDVAGRAVLSEGHSEDVAGLTAAHSEMSHKVAL